MQSTTQNPTIPCPMSASPAVPTNNLKSNDHLLLEKSVEGQAAREAQLQGKRVLFVSCGGDSTKDNIYRTAHRLGVEIFLLEDATNPLAAVLKEAGLLKEHIEMDLIMRETIIEDCVKAVDNAFGEKGPDAVLTFWDDAVGLTARLATHYGVLTNSVQSIDISHDKFLSRCRLQESGIPTPLYERVHSIEEMKEAAERMSYPAILKPCQGAASIGVSMVSSAEEAVATYNTTVKLMQDVMQDKELMGLVFDGVTDCTTTFVLEEFIDGEEVDVDMCLYRGNVVYSNINSDWPAQDGRFIELGISFPAKCNETRIGREFRDAALACCKAIGVEDGVVHVEMKYSSKYGPTLVELNPRMGGGPLYQFHKRCFDCDLVTEHLLVMCGLPSNPPALETHASVCTCLFLYAPTDGVAAEDMHDSELAQTLRKKNYVTGVKYTCKMGDKLQGWDNLESFPSFVGRLDIAVDRQDMEYDQVIDYCVALQKESLQITYQ